VVFPGSSRFLWNNNMGEGVRKVSTTSATGLFLSAVMIRRDRCRGRRWVVCAINSGRATFRIGVEENTEYIEIANSYIPVPLRRRQEIFIELRFLGENDKESENKEQMTWGSEGLDKKTVECRFRWVSEPRSQYPTSGIFIPGLAGGDTPNSAGGGTDRLSHTPTALWQNGSSQRNQRWKRQGGCWKANG